MNTRIASCSCGQLQAAVSGPPLRVSVCHCDACQRRTGSVFGVQARFDRAAVTIQGRGTEFVRVGSEGGTCRFTFCPACGATVYYVADDRKQHIAIPVGAFADPAFPPPMVSVYEEYMHLWVGLPNDIEHME